MTGDRRLRGYERELIEGYERELIEREAQLSTAASVERASRERLQGRPEAAAPRRCLHVQGCSAGPVSLG